MTAFLKRFTPERAAWAFAAVLAAAVALLAVWFGALNQDEGWYLYAAQLVRAGQVPYRDFFFTQGPTLPYVYGALSAVWGMASPLHGLLGGRVLSLAFSAATVALASSLARRLAGGDRKDVAALAAVAALGCNLYHAYFTCIPKTYALGGCFAMLGFWLLAAGLARRGAARALALAGCGLSLAFASGTRISLVLLLGTTGVSLLAYGWLSARGWAKLMPAFWFGMAGLAGMAITYGPFAADPAALDGLLAAQAYHAGRGGFDPFFAVGSASRLARGYWVLGAFLFMGLCGLGRPPARECGRGNAGGDARQPESGTAAPDWGSRTALWALVAGFAAVFALQMSAPFPYDDYQVPVMPLLAVALSVFFARGTAFFTRAGASWLAVLLAGLAAYSSPLLQEWATYGQDRFWSRKKETTELAKLRAVGAELERLDPGGKTLLTQDLYLAVETGRSVPEGLAMGPFCYFGELADDARARKLHVLNPGTMEALLASAPCPLAAFSGYGFAVSVPKGSEVPLATQMRYWELLKRNYELAFAEPDFGQNSTTLLVLKRKPTPAGEAAK